MKTLTLIASLTLAAGCSHLVKYTGAVPDQAADEAFVHELDRLDAEVRACYAKVIITEPVPLELAVDETGSPLAARAAGPLFGSPLGGCLEAVAFRAHLGQGQGARLAHAVARLKPVDTPVPPPNMAPPAAR